MKKQYVFSQEEYDDIVILLNKGLDFVVDREESLPPYMVNDCRNCLKDCLDIFTGVNDKHE